MTIVEQTTAASLELLARVRLGRLACAQNNQPYVVPFYFAYHDKHLYSFSTVGQKIAWMRANPLVCVEADEVAGPHDWMSVVVTGRYEELPDTPELRAMRDHAHFLLQQKASWWEPGYVKTILHDTERPMVPLYFRIHIDQMTSHRTVPETAASGNAGAPAARAGWVQRSLRRLLK